jgi:16S rRNA (cytidine1402-2'-O)-methyltransferase
MATLYLISTPIGNLSDLSARAGEVLGGVSRVLAEDTRRSRILLKHLGIGTPLVSLHAHNEASRVASVLDWLGEGEDLALVSDAGTPLISDPGQRMVEAVVEAGHTLVPIPGPSAVLTALLGSALPADRFTFLGFSPRSGRDREAFLERVAGAEETVVLFESPERLVALLEDVADVCGEGRQVAVGREMTKIHEEFFRGTAEEARAHYREHRAKGEVSVVVEAAPLSDGPDEVDVAAAQALGRALLESGKKPSAAARELARRLGIPRNAAYRVVQSLSRKDE